MRVPPSSLLDWTVRDFDLMREFHSVFPYGDVRGDIQSAVVAKTIANVYRHEKADPFSIIDFMPFVKEPELTPEQALEQKIVEFMKSRH